jgi:hypothetical protein
VLPAAEESSMRRFLDRVTGWARGGGRPAPAGVRKAQPGVEELEGRELYSAPALVGPSSLPRNIASVTAQAPHVSPHAAGAAARHGRALAAPVSGGGSLDSDGADDVPVNGEGAAPPADAPGQPEAPSTDEGPALTGEVAGPGGPAEDLVWSDGLAAPLGDPAVSQLALPSRWEAVSWLWEPAELGECAADVRGRAPSADLPAEGEGRPADPAAEDEVVEASAESPRRDEESPPPEPAEVGDTPADAEEPAWPGRGEEEAPEELEEALDELDEALEAAE